MLEQIKEALKKQGLPENWAKLINVSKEEEIEGAVNELKKGMKDVLQKEGDKRATEASKTSVSNFKKKLGFDENTSEDEILKKVKANQNTGGTPSGGQPGGEGQGQGGDQSNPEVEELKKEIKELKGNLTELVSNQQNKQRRQNFVEKLKEKNIPENFAQKFAEQVDFQNLDTDEKIDAEVENVSGIVSDYEKEVLKSKVDGQTKPGTSQLPDNVDEYTQKTAKERYEVESGNVEGKKI